MNGLEKAKKALQKSAYPAIRMARVKPGEPAIYLCDAEYILAEHWPKDGHEALERVRCIIQVEEWKYTTASNVVHNDEVRGHISNFTKKILSALPAEKPKPRIWKGDEIKDAPDGWYATRYSDGIWIGSLPQCGRTDTPTNKGYEFFGPLPPQDEASE